MRKHNKNKNIIILAAAIILGVFIFAPRPVYIEFNEPKQPSDLSQMFEKVSIKQIYFTALGADNRSAGGMVESIDDVSPLLERLEIEVVSGEFLGIRDIEGNISGTDYIYLLTHKKEYDIGQLYSFQVLLGRIEDGIERIILR